MLKLLYGNRNFRSLLLFSTFLNIGDGMFRIFMIWAVHALYQNPMYTGIAGFMFGAPLVASFIVGPFVDRQNKAKMLRITCFVRFCVVTLILIGHIFYNPGVWLFFIVILIFSIALLFDRPAYTAILPRVVDGEDLIKANGLMIITGVVGGLGIGVVLYILMARGADFALVYGVNALIMLTALFFAAFLRSNESDINAAAIDKLALKSYFNELKVGLMFTGKGVMLPLVLAIVFMNLFANIARVNMPMFAEIHLGADTGYIVLSALALAGSLIGSFISRAVESKFELWKILVFVFGFAGATRIIFVNIIGDNFTRAILVYLLYVGLGSTIIIFYRALVQKLPPKNLISRVDTIITSLSAVAIAVGALMGGFLGTLLPNVDTVFIIQGCSYFAIGVFLYFSKTIRNLPKIGDL